LRTLKGDYRPILLKNSLSAQRRKIWGDLKRCFREVQRGYRWKAPISPGSPLIVSMETHEQFSLPNLNRRNSGCTEKLSFSTE
jgi:hypothetical protein